MSIKEKLDRFGELCVVEERVHSLLNERVPDGDWSPPGREMAQYHHPIVAHVNRAQHRYREALKALRKWAVSEAQAIRDDLAGRERAETVPARLLTVRYYGPDGAELEDIGLLVKEEQMRGVLAEHFPLAVTEQEKAQALARAINAHIQDGI